MSEMDIVFDEGKSSEVANTLDSASFLDPISSSVAAKTEEPSSTAEFTSRNDKVRRLVESNARVKLKTRLKVSDCVPVIASDSTNMSLLLSSSECANEYVSPKHAVSFRRLVTAIAEVAIIAPVLVKHAE